MRLFVFAALAVLSSVVHAERLSIERIFSDPALDGASPRMARLSPDGTRVAYLRGREDDQNQLDLWQYEIASGARTRLVDSLALSEAKELSDAEKARRERARIAQLKGIVAYRWSPDGTRLLFSVDERLWLLDLAANDEGRLRALTPKGLEVNDAKVSPRGGFVSFVSRRNLYVIDLERGLTYQLTRDGGGTIHNGEAEFVAQEEMDRATGYWWAPDDSAIAFEQYDESGVDEVERTEVYADRATTIRQRYPAAGRPNVRVKLGLVRPREARVRWIELGDDPDVYLARVDWTRDARHVVFQRESRDQKTLALVQVDARSLRRKTLLTETSGTWINLHDDLRFLDDGRFVWSSEREGYRQLYLHGADGVLLHPLTRGPFDVDRLLAVDRANGLVYFASNRDDVLQKQVYRVRLDGSDAAHPARISEGDGWHEAEFGDDAQTWIDTYSDPATPPQVSLRRADGSRIAWIERNALEPGHPYWPYREAMIQPEFGTLRAEDGQILHYRVLRPRGAVPDGGHPVFMTYYGGPGRQYVTRAWGNHIEQFMAQRGYVVFALDNRGTPRRGRAFSDAIHLRMGRAEVADQLAGVEWLRAQPWADASRIGLFGWSYGGYQTLMLLAQHPDVFAAGVAVAPVTDWALYDTHYTERFLGTPAGNAQGYALSGVPHWAKGIASDRLLLVHGMADDNVLFANSTRLMADLQQRGTQFELMAYPGGKHGLSSPAMKKHVYTLIAAFLDRKLAVPERNAEPAG